MMGHRTETAHTIRQQREIERARRDGDRQTADALSARAARSARRAKKIARASK